MFSAVLESIIGLGSRICSYKTLGVWDIKDANGWLEIFRLNKSAYVYIAVTAVPVFFAPY